MKSRRARGAREETRLRGAGFAARSLVRSRAARFARPNRRACSQANQRIVSRGNRISKKSFVRFKKLAPRAKKLVRSTFSKSIEETGYESHQHQV